MLAEDKVQKTATARTSTTETSDVPLKLSGSPGTRQDDGDFCAGTYDSSVTRGKFEAFHDCQQACNYRQRCFPSSAHGDWHRASVRRKSTGSLSTSARTAGLCATWAGSRGRPGFSDIALVSKCCRRDGHAQPAHSHGDHRDRRWPTRSSGSRETSKAHAARGVDCARRGRPRVDSPAA